jgi:hypothetical protein
MYNIRLLLRMCCTASTIVAVVMTTIRVVMSCVAGGTVLLHAVQLRYVVRASKVFDVPQMRLSGPKTHRIPIKLQLKLKQVSRPFNRALHHSIIPSGIELNHAKHNSTGIRLCRAQSNPWAPAWSAKAK